MKIINIKLQGCTVNTDGYFINLTLHWRENIIFEDMIVFLCMVKDTDYKGQKGAIPI